MGLFGKFSNTVIEWCDADVWPADLLSIFIRWGFGHPVPWAAAFCCRRIKSSSHLSLRATGVSDSLVKWLQYPKCKILKHLVWQNWTTLDKMDKIGNGQNWTKLDILADFQTLRDVESYRISLLDYAIFFFFFCNCLSKYGVLYCKFFMMVDLQETKK